MKNILAQLAFWKECKEYGVSLWECPSFLFLLIGFITVVAIVGTFIVGQIYTSPELVAPIVFGVTLLVFIPGSVIVKTFERVANASRMKTEFVSIVSHQLRSPLSAIKWSLDLLLNTRAGLSGEKQIEYMHVVNDNNERMLKLVNDLLNVSRIEEGRLELQQERMNIRELAERVVENEQVIARANNIDLRLDAPASLPDVLGDATYLEMVITNFVDNGIRYTQGSGKVVVHLAAIDSYVRCEVRDNGVGIPRGEQRHIFQKFFRSRNAVKHQTEGTGLGLFIAQAVVVLSRGRIGFSSQEGTGSTFWFEIPALTKRGNAPATVKAPAGSM
jgi:signal transduction histidine kinase